MSMINFLNEVTTGRYLAKITDITIFEDKMLVKFAPFNGDAEYDEVQLWIPLPFGKRSIGYRFLQVLGLTEGRSGFDPDDLLKFIGTVIGIEIRDNKSKTSPIVYHNVVDFFNASDYDPDDAPDPDDPEEYDSDSESELDDSDDDDSDSDYELEELVEEDSDDEPEEPPVRNHRSSSKRKKKGQNRRQVEC